VTLIAEVCEALAGASAGTELVYAICLSDCAHAAFADCYTGSGDVVRVSCRPLRQSAAALTPWLEAQGGPSGMAVHTALAPTSATSAWPLAKERGRVVDRLGGQVAVVRGDELIISPASGPAPVAWMWLVELARRTGLTPAVRPVEVRDLHGADEAFLVGTPFCLMPIASIDGRPLRFAPGPVARRLLSAWSEDAGVDIAAQLWEIAGFGEMAAA
jgi:hypothetical protein